MLLCQRKNNLPRTCRSSAAIVHLRSRQGGWDMMFWASANLWALALVNNNSKTLLPAQYSASSTLFPLNFVINLDVYHVFFFIFKALRCLGFSNSNRFNCCLSQSRLPFTAEILHVNRFRYSRSITNVPVERVEAAEPRTEPQNED